MAEKISRHEFLEQRIDRYIYELNGSLVYERATKLDSNEADELQKNVDDILKSIHACTKELIKANTSEEFDPESREPEL